MLRSSKFVLPLIAATLVLGACQDSSGSEQGGLTIRLTDAPGDLAEAWVKVDRIYLQGTSPSDSTAGRVDVLSTPTAWVNLLELAGGDFATLVNNVVLPAGTYSQLRFVICEAYIVDGDGEVFATRDADLPAGVTADGQLRLPSACSSGFKVKFPEGPLTLNEGEIILSVDVDVSQSFSAQGGGWRLHPVARATQVGVGSVSEITGTVALGSGVTLPATCGGATPDLASFVPQAIGSAETISGTTTAAGQFYIGGVLPGTYTLGHVADVAYANNDTLTYAATAAPASLTVTGGQHTAAYTITSATCH